MEQKKFFSTAEELKWISQNNGDDTHIKERERDRERKSGNDR